MINGMSCMLSMSCMFSMAMAGICKLCMMALWHYMFCIDFLSQPLTILVKPHASCMIVTCRATMDMNEDKGEEDDDDKDFLYHCLCFFDLESPYMSFMLVAPPGRNLL